MTVKFVTKRNGRLEAFDIDKVLRWELWACKGIKSLIDWQDILIKAKEQFTESMSTQQIQFKLIEECNNRRTHAHSLVAGRLYAAYVAKKIHGEPYPTVKKLHQDLIAKGYMVALDYTDEEYAQVESLIDHNKNFNLTYIQVRQLAGKYSLTDRSQDVQFETPQFVFMRMAMALSEDEPDKMAHVAKFYKYFSEFKIGAPTPNYVNLGTPHNGYISCCLYTTNDTAASLAVGDHIAYTMTYMSAGIGGFINTRSIDDKIKGGVMMHMGKLPYMRAAAAAVNANRQNSRGGAATEYFSVYDPEALELIYLQNPRTPIAKQNRDIHFAMQFNDTFVEKVFKNEKIFSFNTYTAPELMSLMFKGDKVAFKKEYDRLDVDPSFIKKYSSAKELAISAVKQSHEVATLYHINMDEVNRHTPFKDPIYSGNLCLEIVQPTKGYESIMDLYSTEPHERGEVSLCALAGIVQDNVPDNEYEDVAYYALLMVDKCIHKNSYVFPHLAYTAKSRMNAGVGIIGLSYDMAKRNLKYSSKEGLQHIHKVAERHMYCLIKASIRLGKEKGNAPWMHKTKWPEGWLPIDTYKKTVDEGMDFKYLCDWESVRSELIANGGMRFSCLASYQPTESSSKAVGRPNGMYPIKAIYLMKTDGGTAVDFVATESDVLASQYEIAYDIPINWLFHGYGVVQKFTDQTISADVYSDRTKSPELKASKLLDELYYMYKYGVKTRYYTTSKTTKGLGLEDVADDRGCASGVCTL